MGSCSSKLTSAIIPRLCPVIKSGNSLKKDASIDFNPASGTAAAMGGDFNYPKLRGIFFRTTLIPVTGIGDSFCNLDRSLVSFRLR